jgi:formamidopyrimidine-DNA glycosylase
MEATTSGRIDAMPELPDLEAIIDVLRPRLIQHQIVEIELPRPLVFRDLTGAGLEASLVGATLSDLRRRGKFLIFDFGPGRLLVINPMLAGRLHYVEPAERRSTRTYLILRWSHGMHLRYVDPKAMGKMYLAHDLNDVPTLAEHGPDALSAELTLELFRERLRRHPGEIKGILTNHRFVAGIGNAYADEILFRAGIYPFRKRPTLSAEETETLYHAMRDVLTEAIAIVRQRMGDSVHEKVRDFLAVHLRAGEPCPRCGAPISEVKANQRITHFCRACQPGSLIRS